MSNAIKLSLYTSAFNLGSGFFSIQDALKNWLKFFDEVVIATMPCEDDTAEILKGVESDRVKVVTMDISTEDRLYDGKLKNFSLQHCTGDILWQLDLDERISGEPEKVREVSRALFNSERFDSFLIESINLWGDEDYYKDFTSKWYCHKRGLFRGPAKFAIRSDGTVDTSKSDGCELIKENGELTEAFLLRNFASLDWYLEQGLPLIVHYGWVNKENRLKLNEWWKDRWENLNGSDRGDIILTDKDFSEKEIFEHGIKFKF